MITNISDMDNIQDQMKDLLAHPSDDLEYLSKIRNEFNFSEIEMQDLRSAFSKIVNNEKLSEGHKLNLIKENWKISFKEKPPSVSEFLTEKWIGATSQSLYPYMEDVMTDYFNPNSNARNLILHTHIGWGKSTFSMLVLIYISVYFALLRNPQQYLNQAQHSHIVMAVLAVTQAKAEEITTRPILNILANSEKFKKCRTEDQLERYQLEYPNHISYTTASTKGSIFRMADLNFKQVSQIPDLLGLNILGATATELNFFSEMPGWNEDKIMKFYTKLKGRVYKRFQNHWMARTILDSSPNTMESELTQFIVNKAPKSDKNMVIDGSAWKWQPFIFETYKDDHSLVFPVYLGTSSKEPKILQESEVQNYDHTEIVHMPDDIRDLAEENLNEVIKDYAGIPTQGNDKLVNLDLIEPIFSHQLKNIYTYIHAPANLPPEKLIWDQIKSQFFFKVQNGKYEFYRFPNEPRYISVDQSHAVGGDATGLTMSHVEVNLQGDLVHVIDFSICIVATKEQISTDAIKHFIRDLRREGTLNIKKVSFDQHMSVPTLQYLERHSFEVERLSVETSTEPYLSFIALMSRKTVKMGRNIVMKNNLKSLIMSKTKGGKSKIDHSPGEVTYALDNQEWETSKMGLNANDLSDSAVASVFLAQTYNSRVPNAIWEEIDNEGDLRKSNETKLHEGILANYKLKRRAET